MSIDDPDEITANASPERPASGLPGILQTVAIASLVAGALGSVGLMFWVGHRNPQWLLLVLFAIWDLSPFVALLLVNMFSKRWSVIARVTLYCVMLVVALSSLAVYGYVVLRPPASSPAAPFLIVPLVSWLLMAMAVPIAALISGRLSRRG